MLGIWIVLVWERVRVARDVDHGVQDNNFTVTGAKSVSVDVSAADLVDLCLAENHRRMVAYDPRLLRPAAVPAVARLVSRLLRPRS